MLFFTVDTMFRFITVCVLMADFCTVSAGNRTMAGGFWVSVALTLKTSQRIWYIWMNWTTQVVSFSFFGKVGLLKVRNRCLVGRICPFLCIVIQRTSVTFLRLKVFQNLFIGWIQKVRFRYNSMARIKSVMFFNRNCKRAYCSAFRQYIWLISWRNFSYQITKFYFFYRMYFSKNRMKRFSYLKKARYF